MQNGRKTKESWTEIWQNWHKIGLVFAEPSGLCAQKSRKSKPDYLISQNVTTLITCQVSKDRHDSKFFKSLEVEQL